jgi:tRNA-specific 2-thiouridylase
MSRSDISDVGSSAGPPGYGEKVTTALDGKSPQKPLDSPDGIGVAGSTACGSVVRIELAMETGVIRDTRYSAYGCPATLAAARYAAEAVRGLSLAEAALVGEQTIASALEVGLDKITSIQNATDALHRALGAALLRDSHSICDTNKAHEGVLVGMSGGVDSTVAALLLKQEEYEVAGVTLMLWTEADSEGERSCCSADAVRRARRVAHSFGIPHFTVDASAAFYDRIVEYFVAGYKAGQTPNPCAKCNSRVRFGLMSDLASKLGMNWVATGHYARLVGPDRLLARGVDALKDQSYVLSEVPAAVLREVIFPLGEMTKSQVRQIATEVGFEGYEAPESQEICFISDDDHRRFLRERIGERPGLIVDRAGHTLGAHSGTYNFTIGQRKGLGISSPNPVYVVCIDAAEAKITVGEADELKVAAVTIGALTWHRMPRGIEVQLQVRSAGLPLPGVIAVSIGDREKDVAGTGLESAESIDIELSEPGHGVACGQTAVVYSNEEVVCAGTIMATRPA